MMVFYNWISCVCDPLSKNPAFPTYIEFGLETILSVKGVFQLSLDYCTKVVITEGLHCIVLNYEAWLCYSKDAISLNSQAGQ